MPPISSTTLAMLLADARLPVGGHVHSAGLEPALLGGMLARDVPWYLLGRMQSTTRVEAGTAVAARHAALAAAADPLEAGAAMAAALTRVERAWAARTPSRALREVSRSLGRGSARLAARLWPGHPATAVCAAVGRPFARPVVLGAIAAASGLDAESLVRLTVYDDAQTIAAAMLKLEPGDPAVPAGWVLDACAAAEAVVPELAAITSPDAIPALGAPQSEGWAEAHSRVSQRLFRA